LSAETDAQVIEKSAAVERSIGVLLARLRRSPSTDRPFRDFVQLLPGAAERVVDLASPSNMKYFDERRREVAAIIDFHMDAFNSTDLTRASDIVVRTRFAAQTDVLMAFRARDGFVYASIRDDVDSSTRAATLFGRPHTASPDD
jgi:hypothetical protein